MRSWLFAATLLAAVAYGVSAQAPNEVPELARRVEVRRTAFGVPHIKAEDLRAAAYALAYVQLEDHGPRVAIGLLRARGEMGRWFGRDSMESDSRPSGTMRWPWSTTRRSISRRATCT